jgi:hypothetical protein
MRLFFGFVTVLLLGMGLVSLSALEVAERELQQANPVDFVNFRGQFTRIVTPAEFRQTGIGLARMATDLNTRYNVRNQYSIIRAHDPREERGFDADIFILEPGSSLVTVSGVRGLLAGYIEGQYGYNTRDSQTLALFATYYNALYRGRMDYMRTHYKNVVVRHLVPARIGLSLNYRDWPGRTQMLLPLSALMAGDRPALDADQLATQEVIDSLRERPDMGIEERKDLLEIRQEDADRRQEELDERREQLDERRDQLEEATQEIRDREEELEQKREELSTETDPERREQLEEEIAKDERGLEELREELRQEEGLLQEQEAKIEEAQEQLDQRREDIAREEEQLRRDEAQVRGEDRPPETAREELQQNREELQQEREELQQQREELEARAEELRRIEEELRRGEPDRNIFDGALYYLKVIEPLNDGHFKSEMVLINPVTRQVVLTSPFKDICGSSYKPFSEGVVVIGFDRRHTSEHFLALLHPKTLEIIARGKDAIYWKSFVEVRQDSIYSIIQDDGYYLGRFNSKLEPEARSQVKIDRDTFITFFGQYIYVNSPDRTIFVLDVSDLSLIDTIRP